MMDIRNNVRCIVINVYDAHDRCKVRYDMYIAGTLYECYDKYLEKKERKKYDNRQLTGRIYIYIIMLARVCVDRCGSRGDHFCSAIIL